MAAGLISFFVACGCGGSGPATLGGSSGGGTTGLPGSTASNATAKFHVDVKTGKVSITPLNGNVASKAFRGSAIGFASTLLLDQPGNTGRKVMRVTLTNNSGEPINQNGAGVNVLFSTFTNVGAFSDLRPKTTVSTYAGSGALSSTDGPVSSATMIRPQGAVVAPDGALYFTEGNKIRRISGGYVSTFAGGGPAGYRDGAGTNALFNGPSGICCDSTYGTSFNFYVADTGNQRIRKISTDGRVTTVAGTGVAGLNNGTGDIAQFKNPYGVVVVGSYLYVTEDNNDIRKIDSIYSYNNQPSSYTVSTLAGSGAAGGGDGVGTAATFNHPRGITYDTTSGDLFIADMSSNMIRRVHPDTGEVVTIAGNGSGADLDGLGTAAKLFNPTGIVDLNGTLYVSEYSGKEIRQISIYNQGNNPNSSTPWYVATLAGTGVAGTANGTGDVATFTSPYLLTVDSASNLYVCDYGANTIRKVRPSTGFFPIGIATGAVPTEPVQLFNSDGVIPSSGYGTNLPYVTYPVSYTPGSSADKDWVFIVPSGVTAFEFSVTVEAATTYAAPLQVGTGAGSPNDDVRTYAGRTPGFVDGHLSESRFGNFYGIAMDSNGNMYVADTSNNAIRRVSADGQVSTVAGVVGKGAGNVDGNGATAQFNGPSGIAVSADGATLFVTDTGNNEIRRIANVGPTMDAANWSVTTIAGSATAGKTDGAGNLASFNAPFGIAISPGGLLYVTEKAGNRVRRVMYRGSDASVNTNWQVSTLAGDNTAVAGAAGSTDATGAAARFSSPLGIAIDRAGNVLVADSGNNRVRSITVDGVTTTLAGSTAGYADALGAAAQFSGPNGIAVDNSNYVYVSDGANNRVRRISPGGQVNTVAGAGTVGVTDGPGNTCRFASPGAIVVDSTASVYVSDYNMGTIRLVQPVLVGMKR